ncbi:aldehyde dehydrogenase [Deltaproteobacteria bacterium]|nr:aldehyde dehydrogenase [Deltaproteobacteria bacterium]
MALQNVSRRSLLAGVAALIVAVKVPLSHAAEPVAGCCAPPPAPTTVNAFVRIGEDSRITVVIPSSEMGQGVSTALAMVVAEELDVGLDRVNVEFAPSAKAYARSLGMGISMQVTGGSQSIIAWRYPMAEAGAGARDMLVRAAAARWGVDASACSTDKGDVRSGEHVAAYGELVVEAAKLRAPRKVVVKAAANYRLVGKDTPRVDTLAKVTGAAEFGGDVRREGMMYAAIVQSPVLGGKMRTMEADAARAVPGVSHVLNYDTWVAVVATRWWAAKQALVLLDPQWDEGKNATLSSESMSAAMVEALDKGQPSVGRSDGSAKVAAAAREIDVTYEVPLVDHSPMEPLNCTVHVTQDGVDIWVPTQAQTLVTNAAKEITGFHEDQIRVHTTLLGGGFGRRGNIDYAQFALHIAMAVKGPVQLVLTREEGLQHGFYRPAMIARMRGATADNRISALHIRLAGDNVLYRYTPKLLHRLAPVQGFVMEGLLHSCPYTIANYLADYVPVETPVPIGFWRAVGYSHNAFFIEGIVEELAHKAGVDSVEFRRKMLGEAPRFLAVLNRAVEAAGWGKAPAGHFQGVALHESFGSIVAEVVELSMEAGKPKLHRVTAAVDCGPVVNPATVRDQIMGGVHFGLSSSLGEKVTLKAGRVQQSNFHDYPLLRMSGSVEVEVHIIDNPDAPTGGIGEVGVPPVAPAVCAAIFAATGKRIRRLPILGALETA